MTKKILVLLLFAFAFTPAQAQPDSAGIKQFDAAMAQYEKGNLDSAVMIWTDMVENKKAVPYDTYGSAFFNIPTVYWQMKEYEKAKEWYLKIIASDLRDWDETGSLMEPHTNYKHKAATALAGLYELDSNYSATLHWLNMADTVYRYWGFEGSATSISKRQALLLDWKMATLLQLDSIKQAIRITIVELICAGDLESFFADSEITLLSMVDNEDKKAFTTAIENMTITPRDGHNWNARFNFQGLDYTIPISDVHPDRNVPHYWRVWFIEPGTQPDKNELIRHIKERGFYQHW